MPGPEPSRPFVVLGVAGGIAAYKSASLLRLFTESDHEVQVVPTAAALRFVGAPTWSALSGRPVADSLWERVHEVPHVRIGREADLIVVAPATADLIARAAAGIADDLLGNILLTAQCPVLFAPAMHTEMWQHEATQTNVATLRSRGVVVLDPADGRLTGSDTGPGRLPEPPEIFAAAMSLLRRRGGADLIGRSVVVTAGGTREPIDPVRFLGNRSSGRQGWALAAAAAARGAGVTLIAANVDLPVPAGVRVVRVGSAAELGDAVDVAAQTADIVVMAAAVADFRPVLVAEHKIKKGSEDPAAIELVRNRDILAGLVAARVPGQVIVGFAAETAQPDRSIEELGAAKLAAKGCDLLVVNEVGDGLVFGQPDTAAVILGADGSRVEVGPTTKESLADAVWDAAAPLLPTEA